MSRNLLGRTVVLVLIAASPGFAHSVEVRPQDGSSWDEYEHGSLEATARAFGFTAERKPGKPRLFFSAKSFPTIARVQYTGRVRAISGLRREHIDEYAGTFYANDKSYFQRLRNEVCVLESEREHWLMVSDETLAFMPEELAPGDSFSVYARFRGSVANANTASIVITLHDFESDTGEPTRRSQPRLLRFKQGEDPGADIAIVAFPVVNIRARPEFSEPDSILVTPVRGSTLALLERSPTGPWYHVVEVESGAEGWVHGSVIDVYHSGIAARSPGFTAERTGGVGPPSVVVTNQTHLDLNLRLGAMTYKIGPGLSRSIAIEPGAFDFHAWVAGVIPKNGHQTFESGFRYTWRFFIVRR